MKAHRIWLACSMLVACYFPHGDPGDDQNRQDTARDHNPPSPSPSSHADFCQQWAQAACSSAVVSACQASGAGACRQTQEEFCHTLAPSNISNASGAACISAVGAAYRNADLSSDGLAIVLHFGGPCARLITGLSRSGDACSESNDCDHTRGQDCVKKADSSTGSCEIPQVVEPGRDCKAAAKTCTEGFFCDGGNCIETLPTGEACLIHEQCGQSGFCDESGECAPRQAVNDSCQSDIECTRGICSEFDGNKVCTDRVVLSRADPICANLR